MQKFRGRHVTLETVNGSVLVAVPSDTTARLLALSALLNLFTAALLLWHEAQSFLR